jgi:hypothetical protein
MLKFDWKQWDIRHSLGTACFVASGLVELARQYLSISPDNTLPWHVTAAMLVTVSYYLGLISHSLTGSTGAKDMLGTVAPGAPADVKAAHEPTLMESMTHPQPAATVPSRPPPPMGKP